MGFAGGSAWAMARDIAEGHLLVTARTFGRMSRGEVEKLSFELERRLRQIRGEQPPLDDPQEIQVRNRRISRLVGAQRVMQAVRFGRRR